MACVTLKRPLDHFDHAGFGGHPGASPAFSPGHRPPAPKRRRCGPIPPAVRHRDESRDGLECAQSSSFFPSGFSSANSSSETVFHESPIAPGEIANNLRDELKRLKRRRMLAAPYDISSHKTPGSPRSAPSSPEPMMDDATAIRTALLANSGTLSAAVSAKNENKPLFTLRQMSLICERMCKERTDKVREEYEKILQQKLSEQYDAFVKFIDHQIQQRFNQSQLPSYLS